MPSSRSTSRNDIVNDHDGHRYRIGRRWCGVCQSGFCFLDRLVRMLENEVAREALQKKVVSAPARPELVRCMTSQGMSERPALRSIGGASRLQIFPLIISTSRRWRQHLRSFGSISTPQNMQPTADIVISR
jgi:hypothetical protein